MGRTAKHTKESIIKESSEYFASCTDKHLMPTKVGITLWLGISRDTYCEYRKKYPDTIKGIDGIIEDAWLQKLTGAGATGPIFYLKNAFKEDYKDKTETDVTTGGEKLDYSRVDEIAARVSAELKALKT